MLESKRSRISNLVVVFFILITLACGSSRSEQLQDLAPTTEETQAPIKTEETTSDTKEQPEEPTNTPKPTKTPKPTNTPEPEIDDVILLNAGFGQEESNLSYAFVIENPNSGHSIEDMEYQVAAYDADGVVVETDSGYIDLILPEQTVGIAGGMWLDEDIVVDTVEVQLRQGDAVASEISSYFTVDSINHYIGDYSSNATAVIHNPYKATLTNLRISVVLYDESGAIIGGGYTYQGFVLANGSTGVSVSTVNAGDIASVEVYPLLSGISSTEEDALPEGAQAFEILKVGGGQDGVSVASGFIIENPNSGYAIENSEFHVVAYAEDGAVLDTVEGYIELVLPNETLGIAADLYLAEEVPVDRVEVEVLAGDFEEAEALPPFTAENVAYTASAYSEKVTGQINNPYTKDVTDLRVHAVLFDEAGDIVGAGYTYLDFVPAEGKSAVEIYVTSSGNVANAELYGSISSLSDFED